MSNLKKVNLTSVTASESLTDYTTTYAGEFAGRYVSAALLSGKTLNEQSITILPNVKYKQVLQNVNPGASIVTSASCDFTASADDVNLSETVLTPTELQVNLEICKKDLVANWEAISMGYSAFHNPPQSFVDYVLAITAAKVAEEIEQSIWEGGLFDGFEDIMTTGTGSLASEQTFGAVTAANVVDKLGLVVDELPSAVYSSPDVMIYAATDVVQKYQRALGGFSAIGSLAATGAGNTDTTAVTPGSGYNNQASVGFKPMNFEGINIAHCPGMKAGTIIGSRKSNLYFGTGLLSDTLEARVIDMAQYDGSQNMRIVMRMTGGVAVAELGDVVRHHD